MDDDGRAPADTVLGALQRGRGLGFRQAVATRAADDLLSCLTSDPRWDRQTEERDAYHARLVVRLGIPIAAITLDANDTDLRTGTAFGVLVELARDGSTEAAASLLRYVESAAEPDWWTVETVWEVTEAAGRDRLRDVVLDRILDDELDNVVTGRADSPWQAWADHPRVAAALARAPRPPLRVAPPDLRDRTSGQLVVVATGPASSVRTAAFRELARRGDLVLLDVAERTGLRNRLGVVSSLAPAVTALGAAALPRARAWLDADDDWLRGLGQDVVCAHGSADDGDMLLTWFDEAVAAGEWCATEQPAVGLGRLRHARARASLREAWALNPHSYARRFYLPALVRIDGAEAEVDEAGDDCESAVRDLARAARATR
ncbi:hypothetical protein [Cellulomonas septica]|uniref:Uncharacterized protein n=1 Tax=Cellulomonas septica TaxID=285080 RepID=A0ABX1JXE9_9CELL|nr:hypothetical protein [Cellulomonas septica]NKY38999.1 hypothetical protein [Cellulomonas septica]